MSEEVDRWEEKYQQGQSPWDTRRPSSELMRVVAGEHIAQCRAIDLGCGTGSNTVWLARQGFDAVGVDIATTAVRRARARAEAAGSRAHFVQADLLDPPDLGGPFAFFFDRGCYHVVRRVDVAAYLRTLDRITTAQAVGLVLTGNAREPHEPGPPVVSEDEIRAELGQRFDIVRLREFRFDSPPGTTESILAWSCLLRKRGRQ
jgi:SAM-dependent methyltransferase